MTKLLVFDLDGTLVDSLPDIADSVNAVRTAHALAALDPERVRAAVGHGARVLVERTMGEEVPPGSTIDSLYAELLAQYARFVVREPRLYPGVREFLDFAAPRYALAVLTNKPRETTRLTLERASLAGRFARVVCPEDAPAPKPDPRGLLAILEATGATREEVVLVGDSVSDFATGRNAGVRTVGVRGGYYQPGEPDPDVWVENWAALRRLFDA